MLKRKFITYGVLLAIAAAIVLMVVGFEVSTREPGTALILQSLSDGFFTVSVLFIGCSILLFIQDAGNFYGIQYLFYTMVRLFSFRKDSLEDKKTYYVYCQEKKERQAVEGKSPVKSAMFLLGLASLALSVFFVMRFYQALTM